MRGWGLAGEEMHWLCGLGGKGWRIERVLDSEFRGFGRLRGLGCHRCWILVFKGRGGSCDLSYSRSAGRKVKGLGARGEAALEATNTESNL